MFIVHIQTYFSSVSPFWLKMEAKLDLLGLAAYQESIKGKTLKQHTYKQSRSSHFLNLKLPLILKAKIISFNQVRSAKLYSNLSLD